MYYGFVCLKCSLLLKNVKTHKQKSKQYFRNAKFLNRSYSIKLKTKFSVIKNVFIIMDIGIVMNPGNDPSLLVN